MKRQATQSKQRSSSGSRRHRYTKVLDNRKHPVRGLWKRNGSFLARLTVEENDGKRAVKWAPLKATTAAEAITELKALHTERSENRLRCIGRTPKLSEAIARYSEALDATGKRPATQLKEKGCLAKWSEAIGHLRLDQLRPMHITFRSKMKCLFLSFAILYAPTLWAQSFLHLTTGESYSYEFSTVPFTQSGALVSPTGVGIFHLATPNFDPANRIQIEMFEGTLGQAPLQSATYSDWLDSVQLRIPNAWQDLHGSMRLTVLTGDADLSGVEVNVFGGPGPPSNFDLYGYGRIIPVPEPSVIHLLAICAIPFAVGFFRKR